jgi:uncharacterized protein YutE (UPF0331/DUF86 family)
MPGEARNWMGRIKAVEREYGAIRFGTDRLLDEVRADSTVVRDPTRPRDIERASEQLEGTYIIRVFAEFESALRHFVAASKNTTPRSAKALVDRVSSSAHVPHEHSDAVHRVREFRNALVHERTEPDPSTSVTIREATSALCTFLSRIQGIW